jgi:hypothetical protein
MMIGGPIIQGDTPFTILGIDTDICYNFCDESLKIRSIWHDRHGGENDPRKPR